jgi:chemotaxis protein methyltransferase CheR
VAHATADLLRWAMPRLGLDPRGFRNVRGTVIRRVQRRIAELGLGGTDAYRAHLEASPEEWAHLDAMCRIPISRLWRDASVYRLLQEELLPERAAVARRERRAVRVWSAGCASGEEPCSVAIAWATGAGKLPDAPPIAIIATDADSRSLARAKDAIYTESSAGELPQEHAELAFAPGTRRVRELFTRSISFVEQDIRSASPPGAFDIVLCRNMAFTYFDHGAQRATLERLRVALHAGGFLVLGRGEVLPEAVAGMQPRAPLVHRRAP